MLCASKMHQHTFTNFTTVIFANFSTFGFTNINTTEKTNFSPKAKIKKMNSTTWQPPENDSQRPLPF